MLGINLEHGFEREHAPWLFWAVVAAAFLVGLLVRADVSGGGKARAG